MIRLLIRFRLNIPLYHKFGKYMSQEKKEPIPPETL